MTPSVAESAVAVSIAIDGRSVEVPAGGTILDGCRAAGVDTPLRAAALEAIGRIRNAEPAPFLREAVLDPERRATTRTAVCRGLRSCKTPSTAQALADVLSDTSNPAELRARLTAAFETVRSIEGVDGSRVGAIGFCFGGLCAILSARMGLELRGVVSFHGLLKVGEPLETKPQARILVLHGQDDPMAPPEEVGTFAAEMKRIDADWELHAYPGVLHAFTNPKANDRDFGTVYDADADARSWVAMKRFFEDVL